LHETASMSVTRLDTWCLSDFEKTDVFVRPAPPRARAARGTRSSQRVRRAIFESGEVTLVDTRADR